MFFFSSLIHIYICCCCIFFNVLCTKIKKTQPTKIRIFFKDIKDDLLTLDLGIKSMRDPCYPACISGEQAAPQTNEKEDRERER